VAVGEYRFELVRRDVERTTYILICSSQQEKTSWMELLQEHIGKKRKSGSFLLLRPDFESKSTVDNKAERKPLPRVPTETDLSDTPRTEKPLPTPPEEPMPETRPRRASSIVKPLPEVPKPKPRPQSYISDANRERIQQIGHIISGWLKQLIEQVEAGTEETSDDEEPEYINIIRIVESNTAKALKVVGDNDEIKSIFTLIIQ
jgi:hypothetical protein